MHSKRSRARRVYLRGRIWARRSELDRKLAFAAAVAAVLCGIATVVIWTGATDFGPAPDTVLGLLILDIILVLLLGTVVVRRLVRVWVERRKGLAGADLHVRIVILFGLVAVTPAILVAVFSTVFLNYGVQSWFSERVRTAVEASNTVAQAYLEEHRQSIRTEAFAMANQINQNAPVLMRNGQIFNQQLAAQANLRALSEVLVVDGSGRILAHAPLSLAFDPSILDAGVLDRLTSNQVVVLATDNDDRVRAIVRLNRFVDAYLVVGRFVDPSILEQINRTAVAVAQYRTLEERGGSILITFVMIFVVVSALLLLAAVWIGLNLATQISSPISALIAAAERIRGGDLSVKVTPAKAMGEVGMLSRAFNRMTSQLAAQRAGLIQANRDLDERRRFTEAVLSGVSAGVIGLDANTLIHLPNRSASELLGIDLERMTGTPLDRVVPEMAGLLSEAVQHSDRQTHAEIRLLRASHTYTLSVRIVAEKRVGEVVGFVVTFDNITPLVQAERKAAWADIARRIAHEIKNPLTPIQLASERLRRKYLKQITQDQETFIDCTETIIRRVEDIGRMVDEFSSFARMPRPELTSENLSELLRQTVFLERNRHPDIVIDLMLPDDDVFLVCDHRQVSQSLINLLKNAAEAILGRDRADAASPLPPGRIGVALTRQQPAGAGEQIAVTVEDNGKGLPLEDRDRLTEPYVTTRAKGTGLGLAIVKKIMEDHNGDVILGDRPGGGARVSLVFNMIRSAKVAEDSGSTGGPASSPPEDDRIGVRSGVHAHG